MVIPKSTPRFADEEDAVVRPLTTTEESKRVKPGIEFRFD
jgi:hypothetical protein